MPIRTSEIPAAARRVRIPECSISWATRPRSVLMVARSRRPRRLRKPAASASGASAAASVGSDAPWGTAACSGEAGRVVALIGGSATASVSSWASGTSGHACSDRTLCVSWDARPNGGSTPGAAPVVSPAARDPAAGPPRESALASPAPAWASGPEAAAGALAGDASRPFAAGGSER